ncbi:MAG: GAF domain-containing sensor histidine kinase, partial [Clostridiaceae bacterium]
MKHSSVKVCSEEQPVVLALTSDEKPDISDMMVEKWQDIIDLLALTLNVPSALIMQIEEKHICVFLGSDTKDNPYKNGEKAELLSGLYCETVVGNKSSLLVPNALKDPLWKENPDIELNMISYLGFPILWPDGEVFGTICILDNKENHYSNQNIKLMELLKDSIEKDLKLVLEEERLKTELENRKTGEQKLRESEARYRELFNNMGNAVVIYNVKDEGEKFIFEDLNKAAEEIEKTNKADIIGKDAEECSSIALQKDLLEIMKQVYKTGMPQRFGPVFYEEGTVKTCRDNYYIYKLSPEQIVVMYDDISEKIGYQEIINENERLIRETQELEKLRTEFFANISHELKTPLNIILSTIQVNSMIVQNEEKLINEKKIMDNINIEKQNCFRLLRLINNLIDSTKLDSSSLELNVVNYNIVSLVEDISQSVAGYIKNNNLTLTFDTDIEEKIIACDLDKVERIMLNLLSNAIKFTEPGGSIFVNIMDGEEYITVTVEDTGIGIPEDKLNEIFDRFRQVDKSFTRKTEGSGIGLSLVKSLVEMHGGTISAESKYGEGTKFIIKLPVRVLLDHDNSELETKL